MSFSDTGFIWAIFDQGAWASLSESFWSYTFTVADEHVFSVKYASGVRRNSADDLPLQGFTVSVYQDGDAIHVEDLDLGTSGRVRVRLEPGQTYTVFISPIADFSTSSPDLGISTMWGQFDWKIH